MCGRVGVVNEITTYQIKVVFVLYIKFKKNPLSHTENEIVYDVHILLEWDTIQLSLGTLQFSVRYILKKLTLLALILTS